MTGMNRVRGYTLLHLMIVTSITAILLALALPSMQGLVGSTRLRTIANIYVSSLENARINAVTSSTSVTFCRSDDGVSCGGSWEQGAILFTDSNQNRIRDGEDTILFQVEAFGDATIRWRAFGNRQFLQFNPHGFLPFQNGSFTFCQKTEQPVSAYQLIANSSGRFRMRQLDARKKPSDLAEVVALCQ